MTKTLVFPPRSAYARDHNYAGLHVDVSASVPLADEAASEQSAPYYFCLSYFSYKHQGTQAGEVQDALESFFSVVVVDARDNKPRKTDTPKTVLPAPCRNKRQLGGVASAVSIGGQKKKVTEQPRWRTLL